MAKDKSQMPIIDASIDFTIRTNLDGEKFVHFAYDNRSIGPLQVEDEEEVQAILTLKDAMIEARLYQKQTGKKKFSKNIFYLQLCARHDTQKHQKVIYAQGGQPGEEAGVECLSGREGRHLLEATAGED